MTWPTAAVATTNLDAGSDEPRLARVELKQAVDNVNAIATEFGNVAITSPVTGQALVRSGNVWINANVSTGGSSTQFAILNSNLNIAAPVAASATPIPATWSEESDDNNIVTVGGTDTREFTLGSGTYILELLGLTITAALPSGQSNADNPSGSINIYLREVADTVNLATSTHPGWNGPGNSSSIAYVVDMGNPQFAKRLVVTTSTAYHLVYTSNTRDKTIRRLTLKITKIA